MKEWQLQQAKAKFSEIDELALKGEVQLITRHGKRAVVVISYDNYWQLKQESTTLLDVFSAHLVWIEMSYLCSVTGQRLNQLARVTFDL
jgi:prevent-host-death family protein